MKKGIVISGIITIVGYSITALVLAIIGIVDIVSANIDAIEEGAMELPELLIAGIVLVSIAGYFLLGMIMSIVLIAKRNSNMGKGAGIALGVIGIALSAVVPGILFLVDSAKNRN